MNQNWREENFELVISYGEWKDKQGKITLKENLLQTGKDFLESLQHFKMVHIDLKSSFKRSSRDLEYNTLETILQLETRCCTLFPTLVFFSQLKK